MKLFKNRLETIVKSAQTIKILQINYRILWNQFKKIKKADNS